MGFRTSSCFSDKVTHSISAESTLDNKKNVSTKNKMGKKNLVMGAHLHKIVKGNGTSLYDVSVLTILLSSIETTRFSVPYVLTTLVIRFI